MPTHKKPHSKLLLPLPLLGVTVLCGFMAVYQLRANNMQMIELRDAVYQADKDNGDTQKALQNLQAYVTRHMNTNLQSGPNAVYPPIQLKYTYERLVQAQSAEAAKTNTQIYTEAQAHCEKLNPNDFSGRNRVPCIQSYVSTHTTKGAKSVPDSLYKFSFVSPRWSPDLAGWSIVATVIAGTAFLVSLVAARLKRYLSK